MPKIIQNRKQCISCSSCAIYSPDNYEMSEKDGMATLKRSKNKNGLYIKKITEAEIEDHKDAALSCPVGIIRIMNDQGKDITDLPI